MAKETTKREAEVCGDRGGERERERLPVLQGGNKLEDGRDKFLVTALLTAPQEDSTIHPPHSQAKKEGREVTLFPCNVTLVFYP